MRMFTNMVLPERPKVARVTSVTTTHPTRWLLIGCGVPVSNRWRKQKLLEQTRGQNLVYEGTKIHIKRLASPGRPIFLRES
jgi:hypothetical protein